MTFTEDWFSHNIPSLTRCLQPLVGQPIRAIELGSFEGRSAVWLCEHVLTHPRAELICVDNFHAADIHIGQSQWTDVRQRLLDNTRHFPQITVVEQETREYLTAQPGQSADLIYVDASHIEEDVLVDGVLSHFALKPGGILVFDDYEWGQKVFGVAEGPEIPKGAIDGFIRFFGSHYETLDVGWQVVLQKKN